MRKTLTVFLAYGSSHIGGRVLGRISGLPNISVVGQAQSADEAIDLIATKKPRLVILDVFLVNGNGLDVLRNLRRRGSQTLVMMTSTSKFSQDRRECMKEGAEYFYHLPDEIEAMSTTVRELASETRN